MQADSKVHSPSPFTITHTESWYSFYRPTDIGVGDGGQGAHDPLKFGENIFRAIIT